MAPLALFLLGIVGLASASGLTSANVTYDQAVAMINKITNSPWSKYVEANVLQELKDLAQPQNQAELQNLVNLRNQVASGQIQPPKSKADFQAFVQTYAPTTLPRIQRISSDYQNSYSTLSPTAKAYVDDLHSAFANASQSGTTQQRIVNQIKVFLAQNQKFQALSSSVKAEFRTRWPATMSFIDSPLYKMTVAMLGTVNTKRLPQTVNALMALAQRN